MNIQFTTSFYNYNTPKPEIKRNNFAPLKYDTVSFTAMKKIQFDGIDHAVVEKFKAPIEKFNTHADLYNWVKSKIQIILEKDFGGRTKETKIQRKLMIDEWSRYVIKENDAYTPTTELLILDAITKDLAPENDNIPPVLNKGILADTVYSLKKNLKIDNKFNFNFCKMYTNNLQAFYLNDTEINTGETATKWVKIPSKKHAPEHFEENVEKLKALSYKTWCTKSNNAEPYLRDGDFHIYLENGKPKIGVRFIENEIEEIQGVLNNGKIPLPYLNTVEEHITTENLALSHNAKREVQNAKELEKKVIKIKADLKDAIANNDVKKIFDYLGISAKEDENGLLTVSEFRQPDIGMTYSDIGVEENNLFKKIKEIKGNLQFSNSEVTDLGALSRIEGAVSFRDSKVTDLGKLKCISESADFSFSQITSLKNLQHIGGDVILTNSSVADLGELQHISGSVNFDNTLITSLKNLQYIGADAMFYNSQITDLGKLKRIEGEAIFSDSQITDLKNLEYIGGNAVFEDSKVINLGQLKYIGENAIFNDSQITDLGNLEYVGGDAIFDNSKVTNLGKLQNIGCEISYNTRAMKNILKKAGLI